ncbi:MAG: hypothetical protein WBL93_05095 [Lutisporaceae bacterium]
MNKRTIAITSAVILGSLLTISSSVYASGVDGVTANSITNVWKKAHLAGQAISEKVAKLGNKENMKAFNLNKKFDNISILIKEFVTDGTITQATSDKITAYITEQEAARKTDMDKLKAMTAEERKAYFEANKANKPEKLNLFDAMVEKGILTEQQANTIVEKLHVNQQIKQQDAMKNRLSPLVESKTITQDQATKILAYMEKQQASRTAEMEKVKAMTKEERATYLKSNASSKTNMLAQLVTDKTLTQEQADAVQKALHQKGFKRGSGKNM